jgi:ABC-2 type transport system permease protein
MNATKVNFSQGVRITWTIATKDIADALRNKVIVSSFVTVIFLVVLYSWFPAIAKPNRINLVIYDAGDSRLIGELQQNPRYRVYPVSSLEEFREWMDDADSGELGLGIPAAFDDALDAGQGQIDGYVLWNRRTSADKLRAEYEREFSELLGQPVHVNLTGTIQPDPEAMGSVRIVALTLVIPVFFLGAFTVPHLMFEEKQTRTIEPLLISPATISQLVMGKALAGLFYCSITFVLLFTINWTYVVNWALAVTAVLVVTMFAVGLGLVLGTFLERKQQLGSWVLILSQPLLIPVFLSAIDPILPEAVRDLLYWMPATAQTLLFRFAFSDGVPMTRIVLPLSTTLVSTSLVLMLVIWRVRRMDG